MILVCKIDAFAMVQLNNSFESLEKINVHYLPRYEKQPF